MTFESVRGASFTGDIALDDIVIESDSSDCKPPPTTASPPGKSTRRVKHFLLAVLITGNANWQLAFRPVELYGLLMSNS